MTSRWRCWQQRDCKCNQAGRAFGLLVPGDRKLQAIFAGLFGHPQSKQTCQNGIASNFVTSTTQTVQSHPKKSERSICGEKGLVWNSTFLIYATFRSTRTSFAAKTRFYCTPAISHSVHLDECCGVACFSPKLRTEIAPYGGQYLTKESLYFICIVIIRA